MACTFVPVSKPIEGIGSPLGSANLPDLMIMFGHDKARSFA